MSDINEYEPNISSKQIQWILNKALPDITLSENSLSLNTSALNGTFTITRQGEGVISISSSNTSIATVSLSGTTATVTAVANGSCTITISVAASADGNYLSNSKTLSVTCTLSKALADCSPSDIKSIVDSGTASTMWSVGDTTATITMNGNVSDGLTLSNYQCKAILIGLDHNKVKETGGKSSAHFILGKDTSNNEIAFCDFSGDSQFGGEKKSGVWFSYVNNPDMSTPNYNYGGWKSTNLRANIMPKFKNALPSAWQNILGTVTKYSDNTGGGKNTASYVTATSDQLFLLAEYEVFGTRKYANSAEQNNQQQYTYFANGNGKIRKNHQSTSYNIRWWLRSVYADNDTYFVYVYAYGDDSISGGTGRYGIVPGFAIIQS